jgi:hypothetical protein
MSQGTTKGVPIDVDGTLSADSDVLVASQKATKTYADTKQAQLNGTGFVKAAGTTISYDNTTYVPDTRTITINGTTQDLSADRTFTINTGNTAGINLANYYNFY